ncbi:hypothetical protein QM467_11365 [Rhodoblastus sp. 17X3]|uniref:hypothetical protein n=1 Tax=Rhodoblastus sp. 17X3 TaxID=3047026 RepID=UPI0024B696F9|nr:hypothetical protein [Rhodoblastus sp. 17X3]MDI9848654.1 hypothetical protein [Rhodoblastus sp. 17X3]
MTRRPNEKIEAEGHAATPDPFDPASLRIDPQSEAALGVEKPLVHVRVGKPDRQAFFRVRPDAEYRLEMAVLELKEEREIYAVLPNVAWALPSETRIVEMRVGITRAGTVFLWPVPLPTPDGRENAWHTTARAAAEFAETKWTRMVANMGAGCYDVTVASADISEPIWSAATFQELLRVAFGNGRLIDSLDHPVVQRLLGK